MFLTLLNCIVKHLLKCWLMMNLQSIKIRCCSLPILLQLLIRQPLPVVCLHPLLIQLPSNLTHFNHLLRLPSQPHQALSNISANWSNLLPMHLINCFPLNQCLLIIFYSLSKLILLEMLIPTIFWQLHCLQQFQLLMRAQLNRLFNHIRFLPLSQSPQFLNALPLLMLHCNVQSRLVLVLVIHVRSLT